MSLSSNFCNMAAALAFIRINRISVSIKRWSKKVSPLHSVVHSGNDVNFLHQKYNICYNILEILISNNHESCHK